MIEHDRTKGSAIDCIAPSKGRFISSAHVALELRSNMVRYAPHLLLTFALLGCTSDPEGLSDEEICDEVQEHVEACGYTIARDSCLEDAAQAGSVRDLDCEEVDTLSGSADNPFGVTPLDTRLVGPGDPYSASDAAPHWGDFSAMVLDAVGSRAGLIIAHGCHCGPEATSLDVSHTDTLDLQCRRHDARYCAAAQQFGGDPCWEGESYNYTTSGSGEAFSVTCNDPPGTAGYFCCRADRAAALHFASRIRGERIEIPINGVDVRDGGTFGSCGPAVDDDCSFYDNVPGNLTEPESF